MPGKQEIDLRSSKRNAAHFSRIAFALAVVLPNPAIADDLVIGGPTSLTNGGFTIGTSVFTTQYHPEISRDFIVALIEYLVDEMPPEVIQTARESLVEAADNEPFRRWIMTFFRQAQMNSA